MASSQVQIASSSPFGCVLRDHNPRQPPCRDSNAQAAFHNNLKALVRDHVHTRFSISPSDENSRHTPDSFPDWIRQQQGIRHHRRNLSSRTNLEVKSSDMSKRESGIVEQCASRQQTQEMVATIDTRTHEPQLLSPSHFQPDSCPPQSNNPSNAPNLGASSLVQMWEARSNRSNSLNSNLAVTAGRTNPGFTHVENAEEPSSKPSEVCEPAEERYDAHTNNDDSFPDWESDRTVPSAPSSSQGQDSDAAENERVGVENERVRVADIIRRLTSGNQRTHNSFSLMCWSDDNDHDQPVATTPRVRRRQAFTNWLLQMERDRQRELDGLVECQAVSKFPHRGRIQSMLKLRFLHREVALRGQLQPPSRASEFSRPQGSTIMLLRERFSTGEHGSFRAQSCVPNSRSPPANTPNNTMALENSSTSKKIMENIHDQEVNTNEPQSTTSVELSVSHATEYVHEEASPSSDVIWQGPSLEFRVRSSPAEHANFGTQSSLPNSGCPPAQTPNNAVALENSSTSKKITENIRHQEVNTSEPQSTASVEQLVSYATEYAQEEAGPSSDVIWQGSRFEVSSLDSQEQEAADNGWDANMNAEEDDISELQSIGTRYDWFIGISRPRKYWEDCRQAWYREMLDSNSDNKEICQLIERRRVSNFLGSDFRMRMDQLMMSRLQKQPHQECSRREVDVQEERGQGGQISLVHQNHNTSHISNQDTSSLHLPSASLYRSWGHYQDQEVQDDSDRVPSTSVQLHPSPSPSPSPSQSYYQDSPPSSSFTSRPSIEMELIYDLRGQMEQLHHEMAELRNSIKSCINMQLKLQQTMKQKVSAASHTAGCEGKKSISSAPRKGNCCICYEMQVDSLLYRCGHMCTCLKCAHELQWSTGKCPICRAPIVDVVRAYADS